MKHCLLRKTLGLVAAAGLLSLGSASSTAQNAADEIEIARSTLKADRKVVIAEGMQLTEAESKAFWPVYREYRAEMDQIADGMVKLALEYADHYPVVPENRAKQMVNDLTGLEKKLAEKRAWYMKRMGRVLPASKTLRFLQLENRLDLAVRLQVARAIPLVPTPAKSR